MEIAKEQRVDKGSCSGQAAWRPGGSGCVSTFRRDCCMRRIACAAAPQQLPGPSVVPGAGPEVRADLRRMPAASS
jgi:hypothetical protein